MIHFLLHLARPINGVNPSGGNDARDALVAINRVEISF